MRRDQQQAGIPPDRLTSGGTALRGRGTTAPPFLFSAGAGGLTRSLDHIEPVARWGGAHICSVLDSVLGTLSNPNVTGRGFEVSRPLKSAVRVLSLLFALSATLSLFAGLPECGDITKLDFKNMTLTVPDQGPVTLKNGEGEITGMVDGVQEGPQWYVEILNDIILKPAPGVTCRLINLDTDHLDGVGDLGYALMYECEGGTLKLVFQTEGYDSGIEIKKINDRTFTLGRAVYRKSDPECCPTMQATDTYVWSPKQHTFKRVKTVERPRKQD